MQKDFSPDRQKPVEALLAIIPLMLIFLSCEQLLDTAPEKLPAKLQFEFAIQEYELPGEKGVPKAASNKSQERFAIEKGQITVENIEFDGRRQHGAQNVYFISNFESPIHVYLTPQHSTTDIVFDIPQGTYDMAEITFHLGDDHMPSLVMEGVFQRGNHEPVPVRFEYNYREQIRVRAKRTGGQQGFVLRKDEVSKAKVQVETQSLVRLVNYGMINRADIIKIDGKEVLLIDEKTNPSIFNSISARLQHAFIVVID